MSDTAHRPLPPKRHDFRFFRTIPTRWSDNDQYGHVNNVVYYAFFDTVISLFLIEEAGLDVGSGPVIGLAVDSACSYRAPIAHPAQIEVGLSVGRIGSSSVRYQVGVFTEGEDEAAAFGHFVHVFVDRASSRPTPIPSNIRNAMESVLANTSA